MIIGLSELANYLDISRRIIRIWIKRRMIPYCRKGKSIIFNLDEIDGWVDKSRQKIFKEDLFS